MVIHESLDAPRHLEFFFKYKHEYFFYQLINTFYHVQKNYKQNHEKINDLL